MSPEERQQWRLTGEAPTPADAKTPNSSPAPSDSTDQTASTEAPSQAASDAAASSDTDPKEGDPHYKAKTKARMDEILEENRQLKRRLEARDQVAPSPKPKPTVDPQAKVALQELVDNPTPDRALLSSDQFFEQYPDATFDQFQIYLTNHAVAKREHARSEQQARQRSLEQRQERVSAFVERTQDPAFLADIASGKVQDLPLPVELLEAGTIPSARNIVAQEIMLSENGRAMWQALTPQDLAAVDRMTDWAAVVRFCARLEERVTGAAVKTAAAVTPPKTVSDAPDPGTTLGSKAKAPSDPVDQAVAADDFRRFRELENEREMKRFRK